VSIDLATWEGLRDSRDDAWLALPPKRRRAILDQGLIERLTVSTVPDCSVEREKRKEVEEAS